MPEIRNRYDVDQVRERTDVLALIGQYVALKKRGGRYLGVCPFHQEKTPSFSVDPQKGFWHCFGCGKGGDAFSFLMQLERLTFPEAVERLAERAGIRPSESFEPVQRKEERDFLLEANAAAAAAFSKALQGKLGAVARNYLAARGITTEHAARFGLGYAPPNWDALVNHLTKRGFSSEILVKAGLALERAQGHGQIDRFRNRLMIPIYDRQNRVVAFGGRALKKEDQPKYLNTAETPVFHKSRMLYALNFAKDAIANRGRAIVTEGYFDVIACHLAGFTETVATLGTALGEEHVQQLRRLADRVYLLFDGDSAGVHAALRSQALFREAGVDVRIVRLPSEHDPDTLLREVGPEALERALNEALAPVEFELDQLIAEHPAHDAEGRVRLFRAAARVLQPLPPLERAEYALWLIDRSLGARGDITELQRALLSEVAAVERAPQRQQQAAPADPEAPAPVRYAEVPLERELLTAIVQDTEFAQRIIPSIPDAAFTHPLYRKIFTLLRQQVESGISPDARRIIVDDTPVTAMIAALAVRDPLPLQNLSADSMAIRLREEYESSCDRGNIVQTAEQADVYINRKVTGTENGGGTNVDDVAALRAWQERLQKRSQDRARRIFGQENE